MTPEEIESQASFALGSLIYGGASVEACVRAVLRIATLKGHSWWQAWAQVQLMRTSSADNDPHSLKRMHRILEGSLPHEQQRNETIDSVLDDYSATRSYSQKNGEGKDETRFTAGSVSDLENEVSADPASNLSDSYRDLLTRIKNRAQYYLTQIEGAREPRPPELASPES